LSDCVVLPVDGAASSVDGSGDTAAVSSAVSFEGVGVKAGGITLISAAEGVTGSWYSEGNPVSSAFSESADSFFSDEKTSENFIVSNICLNVVCPNTACTKKTLQTQVVIKMTNSVQVILCLEQNFKILFSFIENLIIN